MGFRFDVMLCSSLVNKSYAGHIKRSRWPQVPHPWSTVLTASLLNGSGNVRTYFALAS